MKFTWETSDIRGGRKFVIPMTGSRARVGMVGYSDAIYAKAGRFVIIELCDGMVSALMSKSKIADMLNNMQAIPFESTIDSQAERSESSCQF